MKTLFANPSWHAIWSLPPADFLAVLVMGLLALAVMFRWAVWFIAENGRVKAHPAFSAPERGLRWWVNVAAPVGVIALAIYALVSSVS